ncbi:MAG TPA: sugar phosphate isomerase/epimerase [Candidatus Anaerofilum excrementigallinarum]|nr:sugar phosphate isomerase/epimerase [Candidatus Anaerofilum excrementigallinarum]
MMQLGVQISSFKPYLQTEAQMRDTFEKVAAMGCRMVQVQWVAPHIAPAAIARALEETGLYSVSTQDTTPQVLANWEYTLQLNRLCGSRHICLSGIPGADDREHCLAFADQLSRMAEGLRREGMVLSFHPLSRDYVPEGEGTLVDLLLENTPPDLCLGVDLYHAVRAGQDVPALLGRWGERVDFVHCKDYRTDAAGSRLTPVGQGVINWPPLLAAARDAGVPWVFAEQETWEQDAFVCMAQSLDYLQKQGLAL